VTITPHEDDVPELEAVPEPEDAPPVFADLTLAEALSAFRRAPRQTLAALRAVARSAEPASAQVRLRPLAASAPAAPQAAAAADTPARPAAERRALAQLGLRISAFLLAWWGGSIITSAPLRTEQLALDPAAPFLLAGFLVWLAAEGYGDWPRLRAWWQRRRAGTPQAAPPVREAVSGPQVWGGIHPARALLALGGVLTSVVALIGTAGNQFTLIGFWAWVASIALWLAALAPAEWRARAAQARIARVHLNWRSPTLWALVAILALGAYFRLSSLSTVPPEMTSDHVEKILDAQRVVDGQLQVFFPNNGGREAFQMYAMALLAQVPGLGMNFTTLKLLSALEGLAAILALYWLGREAIGRQQARLGNLVGLLLAALVAVSYWHVALSRLGLRIVLTTAVTALLLTFLARAMRFNRRSDFILAGLTLGLGLYTYQAVRMLPLVVLAGVALALIFRARSRRDFSRYLLHTVVLVVVAFVVFVPLFGFWLQYPEDFWRRTQGRLLGDDIVQTVDAQGQIVERQATIEERLDAFNQNLPILADNFRNALLMFNWKGDVAWINAAPNRPAMDAVTGALLIVGLAAWLARMIRRRDPFDWLVPVALLIMLLPSALSIAYPVENPSHTRTSGALPLAYLIAALPLALIVKGLIEQVGGQRGRVAAGAVLVLVLAGAYGANSAIYFNDYYRTYLGSSLPYTEAGRVLRGFAESDGSFGNAFMLAYPYWWDHRAIGIEAGRTDWPNGIIALNGVPQFLADAYARTDRYRLDPERDLLFFYAPDDEAADAALREWFPQGRARLVQSYQDDAYRLYRVPALGNDGLLAFLVAQGAAVTQTPVPGG
jgi:hypothetical protein